MWTFHLNPYTLIFIIHYYIPMFKIDSFSIADNDFNIKMTNIIYKATRIVI